MQTNGEFLREHVQGVIFAIAYNNSYSFTNYATGFLFVTGYVLKVYY